MKTIYGLFPSYSDALGALGEFVGHGFEQADLSAVLRAGPVDARSGTPRSRGNRPQSAGALPPRPDLPGGRRIKVPGSPTLLASGRLAAALDQGREEAKTEPANLKSVLAGAGLPASFVENYVRGIARGQTLLAVSTSDERERDAVMIMRRHRVASLGGLPE